ncbi:hypothetical protein [Stutzerimonas stutzeri]|jgi:hypothetical protein|uniref:Transmembrane protein n=1 Tax=Stutzerimonas stutzeri TaxID=316 RepID=A0AA40RWE0_STUST|nr:hypothetical protein [Stutzerimonas stutzeri]MBA1306699.1 hypothetical protein [Stutzerimonas stutzeri]
MSDLQLGIPIEIEGKEVIIVRDFVGTKAITVSGENEVFTVLEPRGEDGRPPIYVNELELEHFRENFPGADVYGLWQILFANDQVPLGRQLSVFRTGAMTGQYIQMEAGSDYSNPGNILQSSEFLANFLTDLEYNLDDAAQIEVRTRELRLPATPAYTRAEMAERHRHAERNKWYVVGAICLAIAAITTVYNYTLFSFYKMNMAEYGAKKVQVVELSARAEALLRERLEDIPDDSAVLTLIDKIAAYEPQISTPADGTSPNGFTASHVFFTRANYPLDLSTKIQGISSELTPSLAYKLTLTGGEGVTY